MKEYFTDEAKPKKETRTNNHPKSIWSNKDVNKANKKNPTKTRFPISKIEQIEFCFLSTTNKKKWAKRKSELST